LDSLSCWLGLHSATRSKMTRRWVVPSHVSRNLARKRSTLGRISCVDGKQGQWLPAR